MQAHSTAGSGGFELQEGEAGKFAARGSLTFATARRGRAAGLEAFGAARSRELTVDCAQISASDSAGMTVLLDWLAFAKQTGRSLHFANLPEQIQGLARISDVQDLLERGV